MRRKINIRFTFFALHPTLTFMSRIGKKPITIPKGVEVGVRDNMITVKGPKGSLDLVFNSKILVEKKKGEILVSPLKPDQKQKETKALWGLTRNLINNNVIGVNKGFKKELEIQGVGYRANVQGQKVILELGFSHSIEYEIPEGIEVKVERNIISVSGIDKQKVGQVAADIRSFRKPEPYKGKGIRYLGEQVRRKVGKKAVAEEGSTV